MVNKQGSLFITKKNILVSEGSEILSSCLNKNKLLFSMMELQKRTLQVEMCKFLMQPVFMERHYFNAYSCCQTIYHNNIKTIKL